MANYLNMIKKSVSKLKAEEYGLWFLFLSVIVQRFSVAIGSIFYCMSLVCFVCNLYVTHGVGLQRVPRYIWWAFCVFTIGFLPSLFLMSDFLIGCRWVLGNVIYAPLACFVVITLANDYLVLKKSLKVLMLFYGVECLWSCYTYFTRLELRASGFGGSTLAYACCLCMFFVIFLVMVLDESFEKKTKVVAGIFLILTSVVILTTESRGAWGLVSVITVLMGGRYLFKDWKRVLACVSSLMIVAAIFSAVPSIRTRYNTIGTWNQLSYTSRFMAWEASWEMMKKYPLTGVGIKEWQGVYKEKYYVTKKGTECVAHAHNNLFHVMGETGLPGLFGYMVLMGTLLFESTKKLLIRFNPCMFMFIGVVLAFNGYGMIEYTFGLTTVTRTFWFLLGCLYSWHNQYLNK